MFKDAYLLSLQDLNRTYYNGINAMITINKTAPRSEYWSENLAAVIQYEDAIQCIFKKKYSIQIKNYILY
jgi:hypothetical protein